MRFAASSSPEGPGSASGAPNLPEGFTDTFTSRYVDAGEVRLHAVIGGESPATEGPVSESCSILGTH